ncbi:NlpC/P60 family protein [Aeromicrobium sp.]|uniref:C40 family peptidase n=1 Tax=Aeromicrobium sp. TaxID=1871063 RepID=UPI003D6B88A2
MSVLTISLIGGAEAEPKVTEKDVERAFHQAEAASEKVNQLSTQIDQTKQEISDLSGDIDREMVGYREQKDALSSAIVQQHMDAPLGPTVNLLGSENPEEFLDGLGAVQALNSTRTDQLEEFGKTAEQLQNRREQLQDRQTALASDKKDLAKERDKIKAKHAEAKRKLAQLTAAQQSRLNSSNTSGFDISANGRAGDALAFAKAQLGDPYVYGGTGPDGWDCSGLMQASWRAGGVSLPRVVGDQYQASQPISMGALQPGDLVFYGDMSHNGMYVGDGKVIHAPRPGKSVEITSMSGYSRAGRVG